MCQSQVCTPLASFLQTLNVTKAEITIVDDNAKSTVTDADRILAALDDVLDIVNSPDPEEDEESISQQNDDVPRKRRVSFNYKVKVVKCSALKNTDELFYTNQEYKKMRKEIKATVLRHKQSQEESSSSTDDDDSIDCMRGLETFLEDARIAKNRVRLHASLAVLTEQKRQYREDGTLIPEELSRRYQQVSHKSQREASKRGLQDCVAICTNASMVSCNKSISKRLGYDMIPVAPIRGVPEFRSVSSYAAWMKVLNQYNHVHIILDAIKFWKQIYTECCITTLNLSNILSYSKGRYRTVVLVWTWVDLPGLTMKLPD